MSSPLLRSLRLATATVTAVALVLFTTGPAQAAVDTGTMLGHLTDGATPVAYAEVSILSSDTGDWVGSGSTDQGGAFAVAEVPAGTYKVTRSAPAQPVRMVSMSPGC